MASEQISTKQSMGPKVAPMMKQTTFNWDTKVKYNELRNFRLEVYNIFKLFNMPDIEKNSTD